MAKKKKDKGEGGNGGDAGSDSSKGKSNIRIFARNLVCPAEKCGATEYNFVVKENLVDISKTMICRACGKELKPALVESATDELTTDERKRLLPSASK